MYEATRYQIIPSSVRIAISEECLKRDYDEERIFEIIGNRKLYCKTCTIEFLPEHVMYSSLEITCPVCDSDLLQETQESTSTPLETSGESMAIQIKGGYYEAMPRELTKSICELALALIANRTKIEAILLGRKFCCARCTSIIRQQYALYLRDRIVCHKCDDTDLLIETTASVFSRKNKENKVTQGKPMEKSTQVRTKFSPEEYVKHIQTLSGTHSLSFEKIEEIRQDWAEAACIQTTVLSLDEYIKLRKTEYHKFIKLTLAECYELMDLLKKLQSRFEALHAKIEARELGEQLEQLEEHISNHTYEDDSSLVRVVPADAHGVIMIIPEDDEPFMEDDALFTDDRAGASPT